MPQLENKYDIEVIVVEDPWKQFGSPLPDASITCAPNVVQEARSSWISARWLNGFVAAVLTLTLHALLFGSLLLGAPVRKYKPPMSEGASASAQNSAQGEFVSQLIFVNDHSITQPDTQDDSVYEAMEPIDQKMKAVPDFAILSSTPQLEISGSEEGTDPNSQSIEEAGDAAGRAMMFGRYMEQIKARIERAWVYPVNTTITSFKCTAQIKQSKEGQVQEVTLQRCDSNAVWQLSLAKAIQAASPLSAPPDKHVFTEMVTV